MTKLNEMKYCKFKRIKIKKKLLYLKYLYDINKYKETEIFIPSSLGKQSVGFGYWIGREYKKKTDIVCNC